MRNFIFLLLLIGCIAAKAQEAVTEKSLVKWMTLAEAFEKQKSEPKKIFIDVYTDWCGWCKVMDSNTFTDPEIADILNTDFYPVKLNAEQKEDITLNGTTFKYIPSGGRGYHQIAALLLNNQLSYPTVVFVDETFSKVYPLAGYRQPSDFHKVLAFFAGNYFKNGETAWTDFEKMYRSPYVSTGQL